MSREPTESNATIGRSRWHTLACVVAVLTLSAACSDTDSGDAGSTTSPATTTLPTSDATTSAPSTTDAAPTNTAPTTIAPSVDDGRPLANQDHWHSAYTIFVCGQEFLPLPQDTSDDVTGIHTHGDSLIHIHPFTDEVAGEGATIGAFLTESEVTLTDSELGFPVRSFVEGVDECDGERAELRILKWGDVDAREPVVHLDDLAGVRLDQRGPNEGQLFTIAFVATSTDNADIPRPDDSFLRQYLGVVPADEGTDA